MQDYIHLNKVSHHFTAERENIVLFKDISLTIACGQTYAITGPSGAGKSSLLQLMAGLDAPVEGSIKAYLNDQLIDQLTLRKHSGFIFQQFHLMPELDALSNVALPLRLNGHASAYKTAAAWLEKVGLAGRAKHRASELSGGEQQRVAIARAFVQQPRFVFADEPTGNLDGKTAQTITQLMFDCAEHSDTAMVIVTHSEHVARRAAHQLKLWNGQLLQEAA